MTETLEQAKASALQIDIIDLAKEAGYMTAMELESYPPQLYMHEDTEQLSLFPNDDIPGTCCVEFADNALQIETGGNFRMSDERFVKILKKFKKCCIEFALATHRMMYEGAAEGREEII